MGRIAYQAIVALIVGVIMIIILLRRPVLGLFGTLVGSLLIPFSGPSNINISEVGIGMLLSIWFFDMIVIKRQVRFVNSRTMRPLFLFIVISILSFGIGQLPWFYFASHAPIDAQIGGLAIFILAAGAFFWVANAELKQSWLEWLVWIFLFLGAIYAVGRLLGLPVDRFYQNGAIANSMFWTWLVALSFSQGLINNKLHIRWRIALLGLSLVSIYLAFVVNYDWKSGWAPALVSVAAILGLRYPRLARFFAPFILVPVFYYLATKAIATDQYSWGTRIDAWITVIEIAKINPLLGLGFANYRFYAPLFPIRGYSIKFNSHSQYVDLFAQVGLIGLALYLWFFWEIGWLGWQLRERVSEGFAQAYVYGALGGIVGALVAGFLVDWVLPFVYNIGMNGFRTSMLFWIFMGGLVSLEQATRKMA